MFVFEVINSLSLFTFLLLLGFCLSVLFGAISLFISFGAVFLPILGVYSFYGVNLVTMALGNLTYIGFSKFTHHFLLGMCEEIEKYFDVDSPIAITILPMVRFWKKVVSDKVWVFRLRLCIILVGFVTSVAFLLFSRLVRSQVFWLFVYFAYAVLLSGTTTVELFNITLPFTIDVFGELSTLYKYYAIPIKTGRRFRRGALAILIIYTVNIMHSSEMLVSKFLIRKRKWTRAKILRSSAMSFALFMDGVRLPQIMRTAAEAGFTQEQEERINSNIDAYLDWLRDIGYPVSPEIVGDEPIQGIANGEFDPGWLVAGTTWRIHAPRLKLFAQPEVRKFKHLVEEYRSTFSYMNLDNQLRSISRYFDNPDVDFPEPNDVLDVVWDVVKVIYENSQIMPTWWIYKSLNKKFNVGVYATSEKRNARGGIKKLPRREWIARSGGPAKIIQAFDNFAKYALIFDTHAQFFTKLEWLKPKKWLNDVVRTPVAAMLPEYVAQMIVSASPNKRFEYLKTPIKLGMPMKHDFLEHLWVRHSRFKLHFAGDCTAFDSTIVGSVLKLVKAVRVKGFEAHKDYNQIAAIIDRVYNVIEHGKLISANSGNVYKKGTGLMTGHASTSSDNSLVMVSLYLVAWKTLTGRSAKEFMYYNELSVYGDDHVLSISELAPPVWNWDNIVMTMQAWGIHMREEVVSGGRGIPLERVPFLKKYCRKPNSVDQEDFRRVFGPDANMPIYVTYHDPSSYFGKLIADLHTKDARYRAKRYQSYMYMTAYNHKNYDITKGLLEKLFRKNPKVREELGKYTPSYDRVLKVWHTNKIPIDMDDKEDEADFIIPTDSMIFYGELTIFERFLNVLSLVPDIVNPALRNIGPIDYMMKLASPFLGWPKALISITNKASSLGHIESLVRNTCYDWISKEVPVATDASYSSLVLRHWIYLVLYEKNSYSFAYYVTGFFSRLINLNFMLNGYVANSRPKFAISYLNLILVILLSFLHVPDLPIISSVIKKMCLPDFIGFVDDTYSSVVAGLLHSIPTSFQDVVTAFPQHQKFVVSAPTGSGKSTSLIHTLSLISPADKIIVIEPRVNLCVSLSKYLNTQFAWVTGYITRDQRRNEDARVLFVTHGHFIASHEHFMNKGYLFIVDEFHVNEVQMKISNELLKNSKEKVLFVSATPLQMNLPVVSLVVSKTYSYTTQRVKIPVEDVDVVSVYLAKILETTHALNPWSLHLIFVDTFAEMDHFVDSLPGPVSTISSRGTKFVDGHQFIVATSTADVGVTLPNVDTVFTKSFAWSNGGSGLGYYRLPDSLIEQRSGRTGRTNNGKVFIMEPIGKPANVFNTFATHSSQAYVLASAAAGLDFRMSAILCGIMNFDPDFLVIGQTIARHSLNNQTIDTTDDSVYVLGVASEIFNAVKFSKDYFKTLPGYDETAHNLKIKKLWNDVFEAFENDRRIPVERRCSLMSDPANDTVDYSDFEYFMDPDWPSVMMPEAVEEIYASGPQYANNWKYSYREWLKTHPVMYA